MREIKFKAWDKLDRVMNTDLPIIDFECCKINGLILLQYTGLKDKNGKEIYERDILQDKVNNCVWRYVIQSLSFMGNNLFAICVWRNFTVIDAKTIMGDYPVKDGNWNYISSTMEVIGNIYENSEFCTLLQSNY